MFAFFPDWIADVRGPGAWLRPDTSQLLDSLVFSDFASNFPALDLGNFYFGSCWELSCRPLFRQSPRDIPRLSNVTPARCRWRAGPPFRARNFPQGWVGEPRRFARSDEMETARMRESAQAPRHARMVTEDPTGSGFPTLSFQKPERQGWGTRAAHAMRHARFSGPSRRRKGRHHKSLITEVE